MYALLHNIPRIGDHSGYGPGQWETTLQCNVVSYWLGPFPEIRDLVFCFDDDRWVDKQITLNYCRRRLWPQQNKAQQKLCTTKQNKTMSIFCGVYSNPSCKHTGEFPSQRPVTQSFDVFFDLRLNKTLSKQSWGWWFKTPPRPLWRHCNVGMW